MGPHFDFGKVITFLVITYSKYITVSLFTNTNVYSFLYYSFIPASLAAIWPPAVGPVPLLCNSKNIAP